MPTSYTSLLGLALPVTGELSGTWGDTVNDYITKYLDAAVAGAQTISGSQTAVTLSVTTATNLSQVGSGSTGSAQYQIINCTGNPAGLLTITAPAASKVYLVLNATSTSQSVKVVGAGPTTGVTMVSGERALIAWNGSDFVKVASSVADGVTTFSAGTTGFTPSTATSGAVTLAGTLATTNGGTGLTSFTANGVVYASSTSALTTGSALTFDGANLGVGTASPTARINVYNAGSGDAAVRIGNAQNALTTDVGKQGSTSYGATSAGDSFLYTNGSLSIMADNGGGVIKFSAGGNTERARITAAGDVGIGTSSPVTKLDVALAAVTPSNTSFHGIVVGPDSGTTSLGQAVGIGFRLRNTAGGGVGGNDLGAAVYGIQANTGANTGSLAFYTRPDAASLAERMRLDSSGNLGLGVTPSAWLSSYKAFQNGRSSFVNDDNGRLQILSNAFVDSGGAYRYIASTFASLDWYVNGERRWYTAPSGTAGNTISFTQAMTLTAEGNLGLGSTSPVNFGSGYTYLTTDATSGSGYLLRRAGNSVGLLDASSANFSVLAQGASGNLILGTNNTERARITSGGRLLVGTTTENTSGGVLQVSNGITFPATQSASSDANTLDDYEEGTWTPNQGGGLTVTGAFSSSGVYTKIGRLVTVRGTVQGATNVAVAGGGIICSNLPFASTSAFPNFDVGSASNNVPSAGTQVIAASSSVYAVTAIAATSSISFTLTYNV